MSTASPPNNGLVPARIATSPWVVLIVLTLGFFMILLDTTIVIIAVPHIETSIGARFDEILWILNAYTLVYAVLLLTAGRLGDMFGPRRLFVMGLLVFTAASAACSVSQTASQLIVFRVIQGVGGALLTPQTLGMLPRIFPPEKRGAAFGIWGAVAGLAAVLGPTLGGLLTTSVGWRAIFLINVPVGIITIAAALFLMPEVADGKRERIDVVGTLLASGGLFLVVFGLIEGQRYNWGPISTVWSFSIGTSRWSLFSVYSVILYGAVVLVGFVLYERRAIQPLLPLSIFGDRNFSVSNLIGLSLAFGMSGLFVPLTIYMESVLQFSAVRAGLTLAPLSLAMMVAAPMSGKLADRINPKYIVICGLSVSAGGILFLLNSLSLSNSSWSFALPAAIAGLGMGCTFAPLTTLSMRDIELRSAGVASGVLTTARQVGFALGSAVVGAVLANSVAHNLIGQAQAVAGRLPAGDRAHFLQAVTAASQSSQSFGAGQSQGTGLISSFPPSIAHEVGVLINYVFDHAFLSAMRPALFACIGGFVLAALIGAGLRGGRSALQARRYQPEAAEVAGESRLEAVAG